MQGIGLDRRTMLDCGTVFYLSDRPLAGDRDNTNAPARPMLAVGDPLERITELLAQPDSGRPSGPLCSLSVLFRI